MNIFETRPFKVRNAEDFELNRILDVFVSPMSSTRSPFDFENSIVKGAMGSGKSIFLKANYAFHLYSIIPALMMQESVILPVFIRLSDFQHIREPHDIYRAVITQVVKEIANIYAQLESAERLVKIHRGMQSLPESIFQASRLHDVLQKLLRMDAEEYKQTISHELGLTGKAQPKFLELGADFRRKGVEEITKKKQIGIGDVHEVYHKLLGDFNGSLLLLVDEAGSLDKTFFKTEREISLFETLMNQFRTAEYLRTKIAVYPHSYSDILVETRYGEMIALTEDVVDEIGYNRFRERALGIMDRYIQAASELTLHVFDVFNVNPSPTAVGDSLEQIIYASGGNIRRLLSILDTCMQEACAEHHGVGKVDSGHVLSGLAKHSSAAESIYGAVDREFLETLAKACRARSTFRFQFPYKAPILAKYINKSEEHNVLTITEAGAGRRGTTYEFDYAFCTHHDIPTHYLKDTERIDKSRSRSTGDWIGRVTQISEEIIAHAQVPGKVEGQVEFLRGEHGFVKTDDGQEYYISSREIIDADKNKVLIQGKRVRFYPVNYEGTPLAYAVELLS